MIPHPHPHDVTTTTPVTSSTSITSSTNGSHTFTIRGYSLAKGMGPGNFISSDRFHVAGHDWAVHFYPDGKNVGDNSCYVSLFIVLESEGRAVRALFELTIVDQSGKGEHKVHSHFDRALESGPYTLKCRGSMWGYKRFYRRTTLEESDYLKDDCIEIQCTVGVVRTRIEGPKQYTIPIPASDMGEGLKSLLDSEQGCDVEFQIGEETFKAHKLILAARSPVFNAQFFGPLGNASADKVELEDIEPSIFKAMLLFIYADRLPSLHEISGSSSICTSTIMLQHLLAAADRFDLGGLKQSCEEKLCEEVTSDTVATTLSLAEQHRCPQLKTICLKFATIKLGAVMQSEGFKHLEESCPSLLSELLETVVLEDEEPSIIQSNKRSGSSTFAMDLAPPLAPEGLAESANPHARSVRRRGGHNN